MTLNLILQLFVLKVTLCQRHEIPKGRIGWLNFHCVKRKRIRTINVSLTDNDSLDTINHSIRSRSLADELGIYIIFENMGAKENQNPVTNSESHCSITQLSHAMPMT